MRTTTVVSLSLGPSASSTRIEICDEGRLDIMKRRLTAGPADPVALDRECDYAQHQILNVLRSDVEHARKLREAFATTPHVAHDLGEQA